MKVWIGDQVFATSLDWTFHEEQTVYRITKLRPGEWWSELMDGSTVPVAAAAIVGWMRAKPNEAPDFLWETKAARPEGFELDEGGVLRLKLDFTDDEKAAEEAAAVPPAEGGEAVKPRRRASKSQGTS